MVKPRVEDLHSVDVQVSMTSRLLSRWNKHLEELGVTNRSGWTRTAILAKMREERILLEDPQEVNQ